MIELGAIKALATSGGEWVIYILIALSVLTVAVIIDRGWVQWREWRELQRLKGPLAQALEKGDLPEAAALAARHAGAAAEILSAGLRHAEKGPDSLEEHMSAARIRARQRLEKRLLILGTLGNNAPFIGLFGTVLGVIKAFHDLSATASAGPEVVMQGLSEALVATAVGLLVAIPAVMAYNYFQKRLNDVFAESESLVRTLMAHAKEK